MKNIKNHYYELAVATPLEKSFTYHSEELYIKGHRVLVPFGPQKLPGVILKLLSEKPPYKTRAILRPLEAEALFTEELLSLAKWLSSYYHTALGEVLKAMVPSRELTALVKVWRKNPEKTTSPGSPEEKLLEKLFGKKESLGFLTIQKKYKALSDSLIPLDKLKTSKWILESKENKQTREKKPETAKSETLKKAELSPELTEEQREVLKKIEVLSSSEETLKPFLLQGVTGSGKTEVYLQALEKTLKKHEKDENKPQALILVPEISLTPQMTKAFTTRFPGKVSVLHSGLPEKLRYKEILKIFHGETQILVGARSCVFAPFKNLRLIVVDEEHDTSYKQNTHFSYHAKDTALVRAHRLKIPILLGSATPSAESYVNAISGKFHHLRLTTRVHKGALPKVHLEEIPPSLKGEKVSSERLKERVTYDFKLMSEPILEALRENFKKGKQSIVIVNRRGYAYYLVNTQTKKSVTCSECSVSMTLHNHMKTLSCHYCDRKIPTSRFLEKEDSPYVAIGYGSQKIEAYLQEKIPEAKIVRLDSDTARNRDNLTQILNDFREEKINILVGTQILAKGHDFPKVTCVALLEVDESLNLPDFRAGERTFQLLVQAAGRAGRQQDDGNVYIQTTGGDNELILKATHHDYNAFISEEVSFREKYAYPPFYKLALLEFSSTDLKLLENYTEQLSDWLTTCLEKEESSLSSLRVQGPYSPGIERINKRWRKHLLLRSKEPKDIHQTVRMIQESIRNKPASIRFKIDIDPQSTL